MANSTNKQPATSNVEQAATLSAKASLAWLLPLAALLFAAWVLWRSYVELGPLVEIEFETAGGVEAGVTRVLHNDVEVGKVETVRLSDDLDSVVVSVRLDPVVASYVDNDARFWIVNAQINATGISGLSTLLSGAYIEVDWDNEQGERRKEFIGLDEPPLTERGTPGLRLTLSAEESGFINVGSPVFLRQIEAGRVERRRLSDDATEVLFDIFIEAPFHKHVFPETRFFGVSGVEAKIDANGATVRVESAAALISGGLAFENTPQSSSAEPVTETGRRYKLFDSRSDADESLFDGEDDENFRLIARFNGSVKGLRKGAPIEYNGITVGKVSSVSVQLPRAANESSIATVVLQFQPKRLGLEDVTRQGWLATVNGFVESGLRVQLTKGNLLTGSLIIKLVNKPELSQESIDLSSKPYPAVPVIPSNTDAITADAETLIKNLSELPLDSLVVSATQLLQEARQLLASPDIAKLPAQLATSMESLSDATTSLPEMVESLKQTSDSASDVLQGLSPDSEVYIELSEALRELGEAARSIAAFAQVLEDNPNAIITGR